MKSVECPFCGAKADRFVYGLLSGPPLDGEIAGGCSVFPGQSPDFSCPWCDAEWLIFDDCLVVVTELGVNQEDDLPEGAIWADQLDSVATSLRGILDTKVSASPSEIKEMTTASGLAIGLDERQSQILLQYI